MKFIRNVVNDHVSCETKTKQTKKKKTSLVDLSRFRYNNSVAYHLCKVSNTLIDTCDCYIRQVLFLDILTHWSYSADECKKSSVIAKIDRGIYITAHGKWELMLNSSTTLTLMLLSYN